MNNGEDLEARQRLALGSLQAGVAFTNAGIGATHAITMAAGEIHRTPRRRPRPVDAPQVMWYNTTGAFDATSTWPNASARTRSA